MTRALAGCRVLVVEDEMLVAMMVEDTLQEAGCTVLGPHGRLADALVAADDPGIDIAVLDVNLAGESIYPVAEKLSARGVPFVLVSGYGDTAIPQDRPDWVACAKPFLPDQLTAVLVQQLNRVRPG